MEKNTEQGMAELVDEPKSTEPEQEGAEEAVDEPKKEEKMSPSQKITSPALSEDSSDNSTVLVHHKDVEEQPRALQIVSIGTEEDCESFVYVLYVCLFVCWGFRVLLSLNSENGTNPFIYFLYAQPMPLPTKKKNWSQLSNESRRVRKFPWSVSLVHSEQESLLSFRSSSAICGTWRSKRKMATTTTTTTERNGTRLLGHLEMMDSIGKPEAIVILPEFGCGVTPFLSMALPYCW